MKVTKAVIPAAGLGTRLKPATDIIPKEFLPVGTKPSIYFILEEAMASGVKEILLVVSPEKLSLMQSLQEIFEPLQFHFILQEKPLGLGHAVALCEKAVGQHPFLVMLPDMLIDSIKPVCAQLLEVFEKTRAPITATTRVAKDKIHLYGVFSVELSDGPLHKIKGVMEKPSPKEAPSDLIVTGRYLLTPKIFAIQKKTPPGKNGEIQLADAMDILAKQSDFFAYEFEGKLLDIGHPEGYLKAHCYYGAKQYGRDIYQDLV